MEGGGDTTSPPHSSTSSPPHPAVPVATPCAACKILRRRCAQKCVLAPYFPPNDPLKFTMAHRVFGASNIIKFLQELPESQRADAVSSMVYEASARLRDPVYGCAGAISQLQDQVHQLQAQLAKAQAEVVNMQCQQSNLMTMIYREMIAVQSSPPRPSSPPQSFNNNNSPDHESFHGSYNPSSLFEDSNSGTLWTDSLWAYTYN